MSARTTRSRRDERRERENALRRDDVLAAAASVFSEKGFQGAQVAEIANLAELSLNTVYGLFKGKEELYEAVIHQAVATVRDRVRSHVETIEDPGERLLAVIDALFTCFDEHRHLLQIYARTTHGLPWRVRQAMGEDSLEIFQGFSIWLRGIAKEAKRAGRLGALDPETVALSLVGAVTSTAARWVEAPRKESLVDAAPRVRALFEALLVQP
ncbi:MAG: TetR/AcrR family transcriptional regulator [Myxococcales bacterium]|nr:TetR/AcrR family transcriptional regulator [Myxococcales bacterium]